MKICHVTCVHPRHDIRIFEKECVSLAKAGYETYLVVNDSEPDEYIKGVHIISTGFIPKGRKERFLKAADYVLKKALEIDAEVYQLHDPELLKISGKLLNYGKKVIFDAHEDAEEQIKDKTWIPAGLRGIISKVYGVYSHSVMRRVTGIITVTPNIVEKYRKYNANVAMVTNYPVVNTKSEEWVNTETFVGKDRYVFFAGGISEQWCHENITKAVNKLENVTYIFAGKSASAGYLEKICSGWEKNKYLGLLSHDDVMKYYHNAVAGMAILKCVQVGTVGTLGNTKLFEVMQAGKPVICSDLKIWREIIEEYNCGICVDSDDVDAITEAIEYLVTHPETSRVMGENGRRAVMEKYNWDTQAGILIEFYKKITGLE